MERWSKDYLTTLRNYERTNKEDVLRPKVGDVVIVKEDKLTRYQWKLANIVELHPSRDGKVRTAKLVIGATRNIVKRAINVFFPIEKSTGGV